MISRKRSLSRFSFFSGLSYGSIYPALKKLEQQGLISKRFEIQDGAPNRKVYSITEAGKQSFLESLKSPFAIERPKSPFLMRLFFFAYLTPEERKTITSDYLESVEQIRKQLAAAAPEIEQRADRFQYTCFQFGLRFFEDMARNLSQMIDALDKDQTESLK